MGVSISQKNLSTANDWIGPIASASASFNQKNTKLLALGNSTYLLCAGYPSGPAMLICYQFNNSFQTLQVLTNISIPISYQVPVFAIDSYNGEDVFLA